MSATSDALNARIAAIKASRHPHTSAAFAKTEKVQEGQFAHMSIEEMREAMMKNAPDTPKN